MAACVIAAIVWATIVTAVTVVRWVRYRRSATVLVRAGDGASLPVHLLRVGS